MTDKIEPDDVVFHKPTKEMWVVCGVDYESNDLIPCGYPFPSIAKISDCELERKGKGVQLEEYKKSLRSRGLERFIEMS